MPFCVGGGGDSGSFDEVAAVLHEPGGEFAVFHAQRIGTNPRSDDLISRHVGLEPCLDREALRGLEGERFDIADGDVSAILKPRGARFSVAVR